MNRLFRWKLIPIAFICSMSMAFAQTLEQKQKIKEKYNQTKLSQLYREFSDLSQAKFEEAKRMAAQKGWRLQKPNIDGTFDQLVSVTDDGEPIYYSIYNQDAAISTRAVHLNSGGSLGLSVDGQNMTAHVWDGGATRPSHQEFDGPGGNNRVTINDGVTSLNGNSFHAQHVTGTIVASGVQAAAKGMAPQAKALTHDWNSDLAEATTEAANGMLISNHSYGFRASLIPDWYFGAYIDESRNWDQLMYNSPFYLMVVAAGNDGNNNTANGAPLNGSSAFDKLSGHSTSKNNMVVANAQDANIAADGSLNSVVINSGSSEGPTDDLRIKPDITGNGTSVYSTYDGSDTQYNAISGTSMASPNVAGTLLLLQQHANNVRGGFVRSATLKGLALHTADDVGLSGPDAVYGWGLMNGKAAAEAISDDGNESLVEELTLNSGQTYTTTVESDGTSPLFASISWTDPAGVANNGTANLTTPVLVNDLDIRVTKGSTSYLPYRMTGVNSNTKADNFVDPFERVDISSASGTYTITVTHKGTLSSGSQNFSLVVTGLTGTPVVCNATTPSGVGVSGVGSSSATVNWTAVTGTSYDVRYRATGTSAWTTSAVAGVTTMLSGLTASTAYEVQVRSKCSDGTTSAYSSSVGFTTTAVQLNYCASNGNNTNDEFISRVQLGSIDNSSGAGGGGYSDFTSVSTSLTKGESSAITVTPTWTGTVYPEAYSVWIDYNNDGDFSDSGEQVWTQAATTGTPASGSFTVPASAVEGATRMRVSMKYNGIPTACESFTYGEVEDYTVNIGGTITPPSCPAISFGTVSSYGGGQDVAGDFQVLDGGATLLLQNNTWKYVAFNYDVTANTVLEFEFRSTSQGEIHGIGFDSDNGITSTLTFKLHGTQNWGITNYDNYSGSSWVSYSIPVGNFYTGSYDRLFFVNDKDAGSAGNTSYFRNVKVTEGGCNATSSYAITSEEITPILGSEGEYGFEVYPNPVKGSILNVRALSDSPVTYVITNALGQRVDNGVLTGSKVSVDRLKKGVYLIQLSSDDETTAIRFIRD